MNSKTFTWKPRPGPGLDCLVGHTRLTVEPGLIVHSSSSSPSLLLSSLELSVTKVYEPEIRARLAIRVPL